MEQISKWKKAYDSKAKKAEHSAQKIRDYFLSSEWKKIRRRSL